MVGSYQEPTRSTAETSELGEELRIGVNLESSQATTKVVSYRHGLVISESCVEAGMKNSGYYLLAVKLQRTALLSLSSLLYLCHRRRAQQPDLAPGRLFRDYDPVKVCKLAHGNKQKDAAVQRTHTDSSQWHENWMKALLTQIRNRLLKEVVSSPTKVDVATLLLPVHPSLSATRENFSARTKSLSFIQFFNLFFQ